MDDDAHEIGLCGCDHADGLVLRELNPLVGGEDGGEIRKVLDGIACAEEVLVRLLGLPRDIIRVLLSGGDGKGEEAKGGDTSEGASTGWEARR